jgi:hypothetical protein
MCVVSDRRKGAGIAYTITINEDAVRHYSLSVWLDTGLELVLGAAQTTSEYIEYVTSLDDDQSVAFTAL